MKRGKRFLVVLVFFVVLACCGIGMGHAAGTAVDWKALATSLTEQFKPKIISIEKLDQKSCWAVVLPETSLDDALDLAKKIGEYIKANIPPETNPKPMVRIFVAGKQVAVAILDGESYRAVKKFENMDPIMFKGQYKPQ